MKYTTYDSLGKITGNYTFSNSTNANLNLSGKTYITGHYNENEYRISGGLAIPLSTKPTSDYLVYQFDYATNNWVVDQDRSRSNISRYRDDLIKEVNSVGAVWWASLSPTEQQELINYRNQLLAYTVTGTVVEPQWPLKPSTLE
jgi:hypothetical protein